MSLGRGIKKGQQRGGDVRHGVGGWGGGMAVLNYLDQWKMRACVCVCVESVCVHGHSKNMTARNVTKMIAETNVWYKNGCLVIFNICSSQINLIQLKP